MRRNKKADQNLPDHLLGWFPSTAVQISRHLDVLSAQEDLLCVHQIDHHGHLVSLDIYGRQSLEEVVQHYAFELAGVFPFQTGNLFEVLSPIKFEEKRVSTEKIELRIQREISFRWG